MGRRILNRVEQEPMLQEEVVETLLLLLLLPALLLEMEDKEMRSFASIISSQKWCDFTEEALLHKSGTISL